MSNLIVPKVPDKVSSVRTSVSTLEQLIEGLDQRGLLVVSILLGQHAMKLLTEEKLSASRL